MKTYNIKINGRDYRVTVKSADESKAEVCVNGIDYSVGIESQEQASVSPDSKVRSAPAVPEVPASDEASRTQVKAPLPGILVDICVGAGERVQAGQKVAVLEAMKMENDILAEVSGIVKEINVAKGDSLLEGAVLMTITN